MTKLAVEGNILVVKFSLAEVTVSRHKTLRIPLSLVHSVSVDPHPWGWLTQRMQVVKSPLQEIIDQHPAMRHQVERPDVPYFEGGVTYVQGDLVKVVGPPESQVFIRINPRLPALRVDLTEAVPYIGFLVTHRDPATAAAELRAAIRQVP